MVIKKRNKLLNPRKSGRKITNCSQRVEDIFNGNLLQSIMTIIRKPDGLLINS